MAPAIALLMAVAAAQQMPRSSTPLASVLAVAGLQLGGRLGGIAAASGAGLLAVWVRPAPRLEELDAARPVVVTGRTAGPWRTGVFGGWRGALRVERVRQGTTVLTGRSVLPVTLGGSGARPPEGELRVAGYLRRHPGFANGGLQRPGPARLVVKSRRLVERRGVGSERGGRLRSRLERLLTVGAVDGEGVRLARALLLGEPETVSPRVRRGLRRAGLGHLLAVSGLHVGLLAAGGVLVGRLLPRGWRWAPPLACTFAYLLLIGARPSILRASAMAAAGWVALAAGRVPARHNALAGIAAAMALIDPSLTSDLGFQLTVAATGGILAADGLLVTRWSRLPRPLAQGLAASATAQLFALPWALPVFHLLSPLAPLHNLWAVPWIAATLAGVVGWVLLALVAPAAGAWARPRLDLLAAPATALAELPAGWWWAIPVAAGRARAVAVAVAALAVLRHPRLWPALALAASLCWAAARVEGRFAGPLDGSIGGSAEDPELVMLDVGQGEAILLRHGAAAALVDGGGWSGGGLAERAVLPALARLGVRRLDALVLTHADIDHCRGLVEIASYLPVREVWSTSGEAAPCVVDLVTLPGARWRPLWAGMRRTVGGWRLDVLHPAPGERLEGNDGSLVMRARARGVGVLLTGDVETPTERALLRDVGATGLEAAILKVAHHGSSTSTGAELLVAVGPRLALISAGPDNRYGHPAPSVLARLRRAGVRVLRTDRDGLVRLRIDRRGGLHVSLPGSPRHP